MPTLCLADTNHESATQILPPTFMICLHDKWQSRGLCRWLFPCIVIYWIPLERHKRFVADSSQTLSQTPRHVEMVCIRDFRDLCPWLSPKLHDFMICNTLTMFTFLVSTFITCLEVTSLKHATVYLRILIICCGMNKIRLHFNVQYKMVHFHLHTWWPWP